MKAAAKATQDASKLAQKAAEHGRHIFVYTNIRTGQTIYSLSRTLRSKNALPQLPFTGKKSLLPNLRKDLWQPLLTISFPTSKQGMHAYHNLREYRKLHEYQWDPADFADPDRPGNLLPKKTRGRLLMDQKANSIADLAAVLWRQEKMRERWTASETESTPEAEAGVRDLGEPAARLESAESASSAEKSDSSNSEQGVSLSAVRIEWANVLDAEYAENWPEEVQHGELPRYLRTRHGAPAPPQLGGARYVGVVEGKGSGSAKGVEKAGGESVAA